MEKDIHSAVDKNLFYTKLEEFYSDKVNIKKKPWSSEKMSQIIAILIEGRAAENRKTNEQYYFCRHYDIIEISGLKKVIKKRQSENDPIIFLVPLEEFYDKLMEIHTSTGHGGRDKMKLALKTKYCIPRTVIEIFIKCCKRCAEKKSQHKKGIVVKPIITNDWNHRSQVDLIDFQSTPDGEFKWLMNYQDHLTKFTHLRPLKSKRADEVASELLKIFLEFGAPKILQSDNGREFVNVIIKQMMSKWPACKIINGRPRHPQSQGSVERCNQDVENMLRAWLQDNNTQNWSLGCYFVQWHKNSSYHRVIRRSPYKALFGIDFQVGLYSTNLPRETVDCISTEEELECVINENKNDSSTSIDNNVITHLDSQENKCLTLQDIYTNNLSVIIDNNLPINNNEVIMFTYSEQEKENHQINKEVRCTRCSKAIISEPSANNVSIEICDLCLKEDAIKNERSQASIGQKEAADRMLESSDKLLRPLQIGQYVTIAVPKVDRGPLDSKNLLGVILDKQNGVYQLGTSVGCLDRWFSRTEIEFSEVTNLISVPSNTISLREAVSKESMFGGQGFKKCMCKPSKIQCCSKRCLCYKSKMKCNSRCHVAGPCSNK